MIPILSKKAPPCGLAPQCASVRDGELLDVQSSPKYFSLTLIGLLPWVKTEIVPGTYRFKGLRKLGLAYLH